LYSAFQLKTQEIDRSKIKSKSVNYKVKILSL